MIEYSTDPLAAIILEQNRKKIFIFSYFEKILSYLLNLNLYALSDRANHHYMDGGCIPEVPSLVAAV